MTTTTSRSSRSPSAPKPEPPPKPHHRSRASARAARRVGRARARAAGARARPRPRRTSRPRRPRARSTATARPAATCSAASGCTEPTPPTSGSRSTGGATSLDRRLVAGDGPELFNAGDFSNASMAGSVGWYRRDFTLPAGAFAHTSEGPAHWIVRFESVNYRATVWLNGRLLGTHAGAFLPFEFDLTRLHPGVNRLIVRVDDRRTRGRPPAGSERRLVELRRACCARSTCGRSASRPPAGARSARCCPVRAAPRRSRSRSRSATSTGPPADGHAERPLRAALRSTSAPRRSPRTATWTAKASVLYRAPAACGRSATRSSTGRR